MSFPCRSLLDVEMPSRLVAPRYDDHPAPRFVAEASVLFGVGMSKPSTSNLGHMPSEAQHRHPSLLAMQIRCLVPHYRNYIL